MPLASTAPSPQADAVEEPPAQLPAEPGTYPAVAADLAPSHEPMVIVARWRDDGGVAAVPVYAQRNGGWRRITTGEWPAGTGSEVRAVDAVDLDGDGVLEVAALGRAGDGDDARSALLVYRLRDGDLELVAEALWAGSARLLAVGDVDAGTRSLMVLGRGDRVVRHFSLEGDHLVAREPPAERVSARRPREELSMALPRGERAMRIAVRAATGGPSLLATIEDWNAELARLRVR